MNSYICSEQICSPSHFWRIRV